MRLFSRGPIGLLVCLAACKTASAPLTDLGSAAHDGDSAQPDLARRPNTVLGRVVDDSGAARAGVACQLCSAEICLTGKTDADGRVGFAPTRQGAYHFRALADDPTTFGDVFFPVPITSDPTAPGFAIALGDALVAPAAGPGQAVTLATGGTFSFANGVVLTLPAGSLSLMSGEQNGFLFAIAVERAKVAAQLLAARAAEPAGIFLLLPADATCASANGRGCGISLPAGSLPDGAQVELTMPNSVTAVLETALQATVSAGKIVVDSAHGLPGLGWLVVYAK
jgi:hypothetical protein